MDYRFLRRKIANAFHLSASLVVTLFGLFWLLWLLWTLLSQGLPGINLELFEKITPPPGSAGGLKNAIEGSLIMTGLGVVIGTPIGIFAGTYLAEFARNSGLASVVRFFNDILLSAPSIIIGVFVYQLMVLQMGHFSAWAGGVALALIILPVVVRTTEDMLHLVPDQMREAAAALGAPQWKVVTKVVYRAAKTGILTGVMLGIARISGETAPLLFTALNNQFSADSLNAPIANLPVVIFQFAMSPYQDWQQLAWAGALLVTLAILLLNIVARVMLRPSKELR